MMETFKALSEYLNTFGYSTFISETNTNVAPILSFNYLPDVFITFSYVENKWKIVHIVNSTKVSILFDTPMQVITSIITRKYKEI